MSEMSQRKIRITQMTHGYEAQLVAMQTDLVGSLDSKMKVFNPSFLSCLSDLDQCASLILILVLSF